ncbi:hypothetical protein [Aeoliella sp. SH292]|uniref:hypothetical protein n=1 Tax=Aeoliella sp. SH292 TaxID=3454464 RepID=UPI003F9C1C05
MFVPIRPLTPTRCALLGAAFLFSSGTYAAEDVVYIEEHWELTVGGPEVERCAPQVSLVMSPTGNMDGLHFVFLLNHSTFPDFVPGGLQMQSWYGDSLLDTTNSNRINILSYDNETVRWVQKLSIQDGRVVFDVDNGTSQSWGNFGHGDGLVMWTGQRMDRLNDYRPAVSIEESGITFAGNRVSSLVLTKLVWRTSDGVTNQLVAPIDIDADIDP